MVHAKNYETVSTFVKVTQKKPWPLFFLDTVYFRYSAVSAQVFRFVNNASKVFCKITLHRLRSKSYQCFKIPCLLLCPSPNVTTKPEIGSGLESYA